MTAIQEKSPDFVRYVLMIVIDPVTGFAVGLTKLKGPSYLLNRITFPGGKIDNDESVYCAASREMMEEAGLAIAEDQWTIFDIVTCADYELTKLVARSADVMTAYTRELEPVWHLAIERHLEYAARSPELYTQDFIANLHGALAVLPLEIALSS
ncbi:MAG: NUDIX domain-containing protein [Agitococcus sp.]|nr:NUDIX domain-containing protein [Agitococcus sp.]MDO9177612.1 NUDIX domain-containing protein [Agitococcus sp.]